MKPTDFSKIIIELVSKNKYSILEGIDEACQINGIEYEKVKPLLTPVIMEDLIIESQTENLIPQSSRLPI